VDFSSIGFLVAIVLVGGLAAYIGDNLGKKIGKKRLSFAGLRPKHSAGLATFVMGVSLSFMTIVFVLGLSAPVRSWIVHGSQAIVEAKKITRQLELEKANLARVQKQESFLRSQVEADEKTVGNQKDVIFKQNADIAKAKVSVDALTANIDKKNASLYLSQRKLDTKEHELAKVTATLGPLNKRLSEVNKAYNKSLEEASKVFHNNLDLEGKNTEFRENIERQKKELASLTLQKNSLEKTKSDLENTKTGLLAEVQQGRTDLGELKSELSDVTDKLTHARTAEAKSDELSAYLQKDFIQTRLQPLIFSRFEEVARLPLGGNLSSRQADDAIDTLLMKAQLEAASRGARPQGGFKVADIIDRPDGTTADQIKKLLHDKLVGSTTPVALIAVASFNSYEHEPIAIDVLVKPNPLVYHRGEVLEQTDLNGSSSDSDIIRALTAFGASLREKAQHDQMIPRPNGEAFGSVSADQVFSLVNEVKQAGRMVRLQAVVTADTRAADPLKIDFRIK
jgi:uncharacterized protein (DUF3084 family)